MKSIIKKMERSIYETKKKHFQIFSEIMFDPLSASPYILSYLKLCTEFVLKKHLIDINLVPTMSMRNDDPKEQIRNGS